MGAGAASEGGSSAAASTHVRLATAAAASRACTTDSQPDSEPHGDAAMMPARKEAKRLAKAAARARKRGEPAAADAGDAGFELFKACDLCAQRQPLLYRCQIDATRAWKFACPSCWPSVSGGIADGNRETHPHYRYGGTWKYFKR